MTITSLDKDPAARTLTITAEYDAPAERVWQLWADPRLLERWWGPPTYPATVVDHDLKAGGRVTYYMTGPDGDRPHGWWAVKTVEPPRLLEFDDGFADENFQPNPDLPVTHTRVTIEGRGDGSRMVSTTTFPSAEAMQQMLNMGMEEGIQEALSQTDALVAEAAST